MTIPVAVRSKTYVWNRLNVSIACSNPAEIMYVPVLLGALAKLRNATVVFVTSVCPSVRTQGTIRLPLGGFSWKFMFEYFSKIHRENSKFYQNMTRITGISYENRHIFFLYYLAQFFLECEMLQRKSIQTFCVQIFLFQNRDVYEKNVEKYGRAR